MSRQAAFQIFEHALRAVQPAVFLPKIVSCTDKELKLVDWRVSLASLGKIFVAGAGKAAASMAFEMEFLLGDRLAAGVIVTKYGHGLPLKKIICLEAGHPVPDQKGLDATRQLIALLQQAGKNDLIIFLVSGGASSLLVDHPPGSSLEEIQLVNNLLLACGATIHEINTVRKHSSLIKGGQLLRFVNESNLVALIISDVPGDDPSIIASGLTVPDPSTFQDARQIIEKYKLVNEIPESILTWIADGVSKKIPETPKPGDSLFGNTHSFLVASNQQALDAAKQKAISLGYETSIVNNQLQGEAGTEAVRFLNFLKEQKSKKPSCFLMGGETTVVVKGNGKGGRNQEFALAALCEMLKSDASAITILSGGTDGTDGPTDATGAFADNDLLKKTRELKLDPVKFLENNDAYNFFSETGGLIQTGPTQTNVMDLIIGIIN